MSTLKLSNIDLRTLRLFLTKIGCNHTRTTDGHEHWTRKDLLRPITFSTHVEPVPEFVIKNILKQVGVNKKEFFTVLGKK